MTSRADFTDDEWRVLTELPHLAAFGAMVAQDGDLRCIDHVVVQLDDVIERRTRRGEGTAQVLEDGRGLSPQVAGADQPAGRIEGDLARDEDEPSACGHLSDVRVSARRGEGGRIGEADRVRSRLGNGG